MSFGDRWFLATAGHIVRDFECNRLNGLTRVRSIGIIDHGGVEAVHADPFPFAYDEAEKYYVVDDNGLDFGFIELKPFYRRMMEANSVTPITEAHWDCNEDQEFEELFVMGLPTNQQIRLGGIELDNCTLEGHARIIVMPILKVPNCEAPPQKSTPVIYAKVRDPRVINIEHVDGFSGSPVFGMGPKNDDGTIPYRVIAMQYAWNHDEHVIIASPIRTFAKLFKKHLTEKSAEN